MTDYKNYYKDCVDADFKQSIQDAQAEQAYIKSSTAQCHGYFVHTLYIPKMFTDKMEQYFKEIVDTMYTILDKVIKKYVEDKSYRALFDFDKRLEELILRDVPYDCTLPIARIDIFFNEDDFSFKFCEFNADGASAMNEDRELNIALSKTGAYKEFCKKYNTKTNELFKSWADEFLRIYHSTKNAKKTPHIAIVDFINNERNYEFEHFCRVFGEMGYSCEICEITNLRYKDGALYSESGEKIDAIYRRAVTCDIMQNYDKVRDFIEAVKNNAVCLIGDFRTQVIHNKKVFEILHNDMTSAFLTDEEREFIKAHIPYTAKLTKKSIEENSVPKTKDKWVIKPEDSYASKGVYAGVEFDTQNEWQEAVLKNVGNSYLLQEYCTPYETINIDLLYNKDAKYRNYSNITGLFVYGGKYAGAYSRIAKNSIISTQYSEMSLPTIIISDKG